MCTYNHDYYRPSSINRSYDTCLIKTTLLLPYNTISPTTNLRLLILLIIVEGVLKVDMFFLSGEFSCFTPDVLFEMKSFESSAFGPIWAIILSKGGLVSVYYFNSNPAHRYTWHGGLIES